MTALSGHVRVAGACRCPDQLRGPCSLLPSALHQSFLWPIPRRPCSRTAVQPTHRQRRLSTVVRAEEPDRPKFSHELLGSQWSNRARLTDSMLTSLMELPGTKGLGDLRSRADALAAWKIALNKGMLPRMEDLSWPQEPFRSKFAEALRQLEMPRFTRRYPAVLNSLMNRMLDLVQDFEAKYEAEMEKQRQQQMQQQMQQQQSQGSSQKEPNDESQMAGAAGGAPGEPQDGQPQQQQPLNEEQLREMMEQLQQQLRDNPDVLRDLMQQAQQQEQGQQQPQMQLKLEMEAGEMNQPPPQPAPSADLSAQMERLADDLVKSFQMEMSDTVENLRTAELAFDDLNSLLDQEAGFDHSQGVWKNRGWRELKHLQDTLEKCKELRELVRNLGRGGGRGPLRRAPEQLEVPRGPEGVVRSPLQPEEVHGLTRTGDLGRMMPPEMALLAHGWPRKVRHGAQNNGGGAGAGRRSSSGAFGESKGGRTEEEEEEATSGGTNGGGSFSTPTSFSLGAAATAAAGAVAGAGGNGGGRASSSSVAAAAAPLSSLSQEEEQKQEGEGEEWKAVSVSQRQQEQGEEEERPASHEGEDDDDDDDPERFEPSASVSSGEFDLEEYYLPGAHAARMLHRVRRAERMLISYDRTGWLDAPSIVTSRLEIRPAAEQGPIIVCLDTSGSMAGAREVVAKAVTLECMRAAHRQKRACYLYAFSNRGEVNDIELKMDTDSLTELLAFLSCSFSGGTDVDDPLRLAMKRLTQAEWSRADILMVTDGEFDVPSKEVMDSIEGARQDLGLQLHCLLVRPEVSKAVREICSPHIHVFKSWGVVPGGDKEMPPVPSSTSSSSTFVRSGLFAARP